MNGWVAFNPDDTTFGPDPHVPVWLTDGHLTILAVRLFSAETHVIVSQYVAAAGFEMLAFPTHFAYAAPPLPKPLEAQGLCSAHFKQISSGVRPGMVIPSCGETGCPYNMG